MLNLNIKAIFFNTITKMRESMQSNHLQYKFLSKYYEPEFIKNLNNSFFDKSKNPIIEKTIYIFSKSHYEEPLRDCIRDTNIEQVYYILKESEECIEGKKVYLPVQVYNHSKEGLRFNSFDIKNSNIKKFFNEYGKNNTFTYVNGPLNTKVVAKSIEIVHFDSKTKGGKYFVNIYIEKPTRIEVHPLQVKNYRMIKDQQFHFKKCRENQYNNNLMREEMARNKYLNNKNELKKENITQTSFSYTKTMSFFSDFSDNLPVIKKEEEIKTKIKFVFNKDNHYKQIQEEFKKRGNKRKLSESKSSVIILPSGYIGVNESIKKMRRK